MKSFFLRRLASCCSSQDDEYISNPSLPNSESKFELQSNHKPYSDYDTPSPKLPRYIDYEPHTPEPAPLNSRYHIKTNRSPVYKSKSESPIIKKINHNSESSIIPKKDKIEFSKYLESILKKNL